MIGYPFDPAEQAKLIQLGKPIPPFPELPPMPTPSPSGGMPAARLGDMTSHFGKIGPVVTGLNVWIGGKPSATMGDPHICPMFDGPKPHVGGTILKGSSTVYICKKPAARVNDPIVCIGPPGTVGPLACMNVFIGG